MVDFTKPVKFADHDLEIVNTLDQGDGTRFVIYKQRDGKFGSIVCNASSGAALYLSATWNIINTPVDRFMNLYADGEAAKQGGCKVHGYAYETERAADAVASVHRIGGKAIEVTLPVT